MLLQKWLNDKIKDNMVNDKMVNIFERVQKKTPYRTPEGFFEQQEQELKDKVTMYNVQRKPLRRKWFYAAAASIILIGGIYGVTRLFVHPSAGSDIFTPDTAPIYSQNSSVSDDWSDFADADMFLDNMNW